MIPPHLSSYACLGMRGVVGRLHNGRCPTASVGLCMPRHARWLLRRLGVMPGPYIESHLIVQRRSAPVAYRCCNTATCLLSQRIPGWDLIKGDHMDGSARRPRGRWIMGDSQQNSATPNTDFSVPRQACSFSNPGNPDVSRDTHRTPTSTTTLNIEPHPPKSSLTIIAPATAKRDRFRFCSSASTN